MSGALATPLLRDIARSSKDKPRAGCCDLCGGPVPPEHRHVLDLDSGEPQCACRACAVLFDREQAGGGHYRLIPQRRLRLADTGFNERLFAALGIPVDLAFVYEESHSGKLVARYPGALGLITASPAPDAWAQLLEQWPALADMQADVEALLLNRARGAREAWVVSIEDCYRLAARVREHWSGFTGGDLVWEEVAGFFAELSAEREEAPWR